MAVPVVREGLQVAVSKCAVSYTGEECLQHSLELPRQACPSKVRSGVAGRAFIWRLIADDQHQEHLRVRGGVWLRILGLILCHDPQQHDLDTSDIYQIIYLFIYLMEKYSYTYLDILLINRKDRDKQPIIKHSLNYTDLTFFF